MASTQTADAIGPVKSRDLELGRELGNRPVPTHIARLQRPNAEPDLVIATRIDRGGPLTVDEAMDLSRVARLLSRNPHPNLTRVRDVVVRDTDMLVVEGFLDGQSLAELWRTARNKGSPLPLAVSLRIVLDVLSGLEALHSVRLAAGQPAGLVHGELTPGNVIVGQDGIVRLIHTCRVASAWSSVPEAPRYMAPEILMRERDLDARADLYSVGALLWESISGKPAIEATSAAAVVKYLARGPLPAPALPRNAAWATPVAAIAMRALSADREARYEHAAKMRDELLMEVRARVAPPEDVARWVRQLAGTLIQERRRRFANEGEARLSIDVELSSPGIVLPDRSAGSKPVPEATKTTPAPAMVSKPLQDSIKTTPAPRMESAPAVGRKPPPPPAIASRPPGTAPVLAPPRDPVVASAPEPVEVSPSIDQPVAFSPAMAPSMGELAVVAPDLPVSEPSERKSKKKVAWIAAAVCVVAGVVLGTWLGLRWTRGSAPERSTGLPAAPTAEPQARPAAPPAPSPIAAEPPTTARPEEPKPDEARPGGGAAEGQAPPVAHGMPGSQAAPAAAASAAPEPSQAAPAATPDPIPAAPPRTTKPDTEPRKTKGKYQPLGI